MKLNYFLKILPVIIYAFGLLLAGQVLAVDVSCDCFCATENGAESIGTMTVVECEKKCISNKQGIVTCAQNASQYPSQNPKCFTQDQCTAIQTALQEKCTADKKTGCQRISTAWDDRQPKICPADMHYCYQATIEDIGLAIEIGGAKSVQDYGDYINKVYEFLLNVAGTMAIVMIMIGGVQYVMAAGSGKVEEAKDRIKGAVIGFVLLFLAYAILYTVNPVLVKMDIPRMPLIKGVEYVSGDSCENLKPMVEKQWIKITEPKAGKNGDGYCGTVAKVEKLNDESTVGLSDTCEYRECQGGNETCLGNKDQAVCTICELMGPDGDRGIKPSSSVCAMLTRTNKENKVIDPDGQVEKQHYCWYSHDYNLFVGASSVIIIPPYEALRVNLGTCASLTLDCSKIDTCSDYDTLEVKSAARTAKVELDWVDPSQNLPENMDIQQMCETDPCRWARSDKDKDCYYVEGYLADDCKTKK